MKREKMKREKMKEGMMMTRQDRFFTGIGRGFPDIDVENKHIAPFTPISTTSLSLPSSRSMNLSYLV